MKKDLNIFTENISKIQIVDLLDETNDYICDHLKINLSTLKRLFKYYQIKRTKEQINLIRKKTNIKKYGVDNLFKDKKFIENCMKNKYGVTHNSYLDETKKKRVETYFKKTGYKYNSQNPESRQKVIDTCIERYGVDNVRKSDIIKKKIKNTKLIKYGDENYLNRNKINKTCFEKYGVLWPCQLKQVRRISSNNSKPNLKFEKLLEDHNLSFEREFALNKFVYDFKLDNYLIEINPTITHKTYSYNKLSKFSVDKDYHKRKAINAEVNNYKCIHIFDWVDKEIIIDAMKNRDEIIFSDFSDPQVYKYNFKTKELDKLTNDDSLALNENEYIIYGPGQDVFINEKSIYDNMRMINSNG